MENMYNCSLYYHVGSINQLLSCCSQGDPLQDENGDKDTEKVKEGDDSIDKKSIDDGKLSASSPSAKSKCKKSLPSVKRKRNQRKKNTSIDENEQANNHHSDSNRNHSSNQSKDLLTPSQSYPTYVITKRAGCGRSGRHRKKKLQPKMPPKLTVVISKVGGQIIAKKKEDNPVKLETASPLNPTNLGRKSLEVK